MMNHRSKTTWALVAMLLAAAGLLAPRARAQATQPAGRGAGAAQSVAVVTIPFYYAQPTVFDAPVTQLVLGVGDHAQSGDAMISNDRKYFTYDVLHPLPKVEQLSTFSHEKSYLGWVGCPAPQPVVNKPNPNANLLPTVATSPHDAAPPATSPLEKPGMVFIAPAR